MKLNLKKTAVVSCLILFALFSYVFADDLKKEFYPAQAKDISDRAYEPAIIELLDGAKESIVISMYNISLGTKGSNPIRFLIRDLVEARHRGVEVTIYLNTHFREIDQGPYQLIRDPALKNLMDEGCVIHLMPKHLRLHDKLIIVDKRYVVEGSTNWSISALKGNLESATLIDSPELAGIKLLRLKMFPLSEKAEEKPVRQALYLENLPRDMAVPKTLLLNSGYFPKMVSDHDTRCIDMYLLLLARSRIEGKTGFFLDLESMGLSLGMPASWPDYSLRRQVIKSLNKLSKRYKLVHVKFFHSKDAWVEIINLSGETFSVSSKFIGNEISLRLKFLLMIKSLLESQGENIGSISKQDLARRFHIHPWTVGEAFKELEQYEAVSR